MTYQTVNPYTNAEVKTFAEHTDIELNGLLTRAQNTFETWRAMSFAGRKSVCKRAAAILRERPDEFANLITLEMGKLYSESLGEVELSASIIDYYADRAESLLAPEHLPTTDAEEGEPVVFSSPIGVLLGIQPWNFPYYQLARVAAPNLMAGNVVMIKHAPIVPQCAAAFEDLFLEAGAPAGVYTNIYASNEQIGTLIDDPRIRGVALTGSERAGAIVGARAGQNCKKSTMELGGSDALIVLADADLDKTVEWALWGRINNGGQCCVASKRIIVVEPVAAEFLTKFTAAMANLHAGDPYDATTTLPPMCSQGAADGLNAQVAAAATAGATVAPLGQTVPTRGAFVQPAIITDISANNPAYDQEFFGPVALFFRVADEDEAIRLANDSSFGLGGSIFTADTEHGVDLAQRIDTGMVFINHPTWTRADLPFGGVKRSGFGHELAGFGIQEFVNKKLINVVPIDAAA